MNKAEANEEAKRIYNHWRSQHEQIEKEAKENGTWQTVGLDSNRHLFKSVDAEAKEKLKKLSEMIDD